MSSSGNSSATVGSSTDDTNANYPLWKYMIVLERIGKKGGNVKFECKYCHKSYVGSYSRVFAHLLKIKGQGIATCNFVTPQVKFEMQKLTDEAEHLKRSKSSSTPLPPTSNPPGGISHMGGSSLMPDVQLKKRKGVNDSAVAKAFNNEAREQLRGEIARMFYSSGLPFHLARNPHYINSYTFASNNNIAGFIPPGYNALRTTLLQRERTNIERLLMPIKDSWSEKGVSIVSDGWGDPQRRPLINIMAVTKSSPMFLRAVNCEGEIKDRFFIANLLKEAIMEVGSRSVVQVVTDNAPVCKSAGLIIESQFPHIFWTPCVVHTLNLALKNICAPKNTEANQVAFHECRWISELAEDAVLVNNFIANHSMRLALFNRFVPLKLLSVAETRFASVIVMLKRFKLIKRGLKELVISDEWEAYREDDVGKAQNVKEIILNDLWWDKVERVISFTNLIYEMLRCADTDKLTLHLIYDMWDSMIEGVKASIYRFEGKELTEESSFYSIVHSILVGRWNKSNTPLHCLAHSLNPRYYSKEWINGAPNRVPPHKDQEISNERNKCLMRYFPNDEERTKVTVEFANFSAFMGIFSSYDSMKDRASLDPKAWWVIYGASTPSLQSLALKVLGQPSSSSCSERNWSTYSFIYSMRRNKIVPQRAEDLVFVHTNLRLLSRKSHQYMTGESKMWDIGGDSFDSMDGAGILEVANLSLDEPEMEGVLFTENVDHVDEEEEEVSQH
ncbi:uncharacterized protein LOC120004739 [Tripterygium wilfordii]|uniref:uncharacterized protein LOC120004739 n=1 Tax=Tripterygium wilfordii TaxID=458696 RepID=UPI0018F813AA|nr:uncharacterized protein LOC120004739 [Tripterygium wilfordii]